MQCFLLLYYVRSCIAHDIQSVTILRHECNIFHFLLFFFTSGGRYIFSVFVHVCVCKCRQNLFEWQNDRGNMFWGSRYGEIPCAKTQTASCIRDLQSIHGIPRNPYIYNREREWSYEDDAC